MPDKETKMRRNLLEGNINMPPCHVKYLVDYLFDAGPTIMTGTGQVPLTHSEIKYWLHNAGITLSPWECKMIRMSSIEYLNQFKLSSKHSVSAPFGNSGIIITTNSMQDSIRKMAK